jgi:hypothetical protein
MRRRRGHSFVEMLVIMSAASAILTISAVLIHRTMHLASQTRAFHAEEATAWRLSAAMRRDAASASSIGIALANEELTVTLHNDTADPIRYRFNGPQIQRLQRIDSDREAHEAYELPSVAQWAAESLDEAGAIRISAIPSTLPTRSPAPVNLSLLVRAAGGPTQ